MSVEKKDKKIKRIPYGISDYALIRRENYYYVDKTRYLHTISDAGRYLFFIRPRRFGKSLFINLMEAYFDVFHRDRFGELFKGTWIYDHPTGEKNSYLVLKFNFSAVDPDPEHLLPSFLNYVRDRALGFIDKYDGYLSSTRKDYFSKTIEESSSASDIFSNLLSLCKRSNQELYVLIDEYDNFSNTILSTVGKDAYQDLTRGPGAFRSFFNVLKSGTTDIDAPVSRSFITGVSPITMDDVTSGYNIGGNISMEPYFNRMLGFTRDEITEMIEYYRSMGAINHPTGYLLDIMNAWYGNYLFSEDDDVRLFNSDMALYFLNNYMTRKELPKDLIDSNVRVDYGKLRHLIIVDRDRSKDAPALPNGNFSKLKEIIQEKGTPAKIAKGFPLEKLIQPENFKSLLFYLGLLTIKGPEKDKLRLEIPNETIKRLYYDYIEEAYRETVTFSLDLSRYSDMMTDLAYDGEWQPLIEYITGRMRESMSLRDLITGEKSIQAFLNVYLGLSDLYIVHAEKELNKGFADLVLEPFLARYEGIKYSYILEIKYLKAGIKAGDAKVNQAKAEAEEQLKRYHSDEKFMKNIAKTKLIKLALVFSGHEAVHIAEVK
jgi:hypothetical protein